MTVRKPHRILIAIDVSRPAQAALETALRFPWPSSSRGRGIGAERVLLGSVAAGALNNAPVVLLVR